MLNERRHVAASVFGKFRLENTVDEATSVRDFSCFAAWTVDKRRTNLVMRLLDEAVLLVEAIVIRVYDARKPNNISFFRFRLDQLER
mmetsp:Transcript_9512/g.23346  ORF Transcript_9512/g.23346 Transcript_9512/m.23346 type:complete len:87 (+) Transcript_9512:865-1125(+)